MSYLIKLSFKNLFRHKLRTSVSIAAIVVSIIVVVFARGLITGMINSTYADYIQYNSGHIRIIDNKYEQKERLLSLNYPVDGFRGKGIDNMMAELNEINNVKMVVPRLKFGGAASTGDELVEMMGWGVKAKKEVEFTRLDDKLVEGRMVKEGKMEVIMGSQLLQDLNKNVGDKVTIMYNTSFNSFKGATFKIVGRIESNLKLVNEKLFYLPLDRAQYLLYMDNMATELLLVAEDRDLTAQIVSPVNQLLAENNTADKYAVIPWYATGGLIPWLELAKNIYNIVYVFIIGLASFVVINTMIMIVNERTQEIGMMSALGLDKRSILKLFVWEGAIMGGIGSIIGAILGGIITEVFSITGLNFSEGFEGVGEEILMSPIIYPQNSLYNIIFAFVLGVIIVTIASIIPARKAANLEPTDALRNVN